MSDEEKPVPQILGHAYWLPPPHGLFLEALLTELVNSPENVSITVTKQRTSRGTWFYSFDMQKGSDKVPDL